MVSLKRDYYKEETFKKIFKKVLKAKKPSTEERRQKIQRRYEEDTKKPIRKHKTDNVVDSVEECTTFT